VILADENIDYRIIRALRNEGIDVFSVFENYRGITDYEVIKHSVKEKKILLTEDKDFGEWVFSHKEKGLSVILLRYSFHETPQIITILIKLLKEDSHKLHFAYTTITTQKIRIRKI